MKNEPLVSIVIPMYNAERYISVTLKSIFKQTYTNFEVIIVNDGSTDSSLKITKKMIKNDRRFNVISQNNKGPGFARNVGLGRAHGDYLLFLDADDVYDQNMIRRMVDVAVSNNTEVVICNSVPVNDSMAPLGISYLRLRYLPKKNIFNALDVKKYSFMYTIGWAWDKLFKADFIKQHGLKFQNIKNTEDAYFVFSALFKAKKISIIKDVMVKHRLGITTSVSSDRSKSYDCFWEAILALKKELEHDNLYSSLEKGFVNWALYFSIWNLATIAPIYKENVYNLIKNKILVELRFGSHKKSFYSYGADYDTCLFIAKNPYSNFTKRHGSLLLYFKRYCNCIKNDGFKNATLKAIYYWRKVL